MSDLTSLIVQKRELEELLNHPQWLKLISVLQEQADGLQQLIVFTPLAGMDMALKQEYQKGQLEGRLSISSTVQAMLDSLARDIEAARGKKEEDDE